jgi:transcriptional regulator with GAF, ATPase, and Fis domain
MAHTDPVDANFFDRLVALADSLVAGFDLVDLADQLVHSCVEFLPVRDAGIMIDDQRGALRVLASTSEETRLLELLELQNNQGPCLEAFDTGTTVTAPDLHASDGRWPRFEEEAGRLGILGAYAVPMQLKERTIGALNLFCSDPVQLDEEELRVAHVMSTMATLGILNHWTVRRQEVLAEQLQHALNSRIVIEQAKGVVAERAQVDMATAFDMLRSFARSSRRSLAVVASEVSQGRLDLSATPESATDGHG